MTTPVLRLPTTQPPPPEPEPEPKSPGVTERLAAASASRPRRAFAAWGMIVVASVVLVITSLHGLTSNAHVVGSTPSSRAEALYAQTIGAADGQKPTDVVVVSSKTATVDQPAFRSLVAGLDARLQTDPGITDLQTDLNPGSPTVSADGHSALIGLRAATDTDIKPVVATVQTLNGPGGFSVSITGDHTVGNDFTSLSSSDLRHGEIDFGLPIAIVILMLVFGAVVAGLMPVLMALLSIVVGLGIATLVAQEFSLSVFIVNMMTGMGLALGIDYSLFVISRFREERGRGLDTQAAIRMTGATAGRAVLFSGTTFVIALLGLFLVPTNVLRSLAAGAVIVGVVSVAAALTLLPAMLSLLGDHLNSLRIPLVGRHLGHPGTGEARIWRAVIAKVMRRPLPSLVIAAGLMIVAATPVLGLHIGQSGVATLPNNLPSKQGYLALAQHFPDQNPYPVEIVTAGGTPTDRTDLTRLEGVLAANPRFGPGTIQTAADGKTLALTVPIQGDVVSSRDVAAVVNLRRQLTPSAFDESGTKVYVGGKTADTADYFHAVSSPTPYVLALRARTQLPPPAPGVPVNRDRRRLDPAQPALRRRRLRPAHARVPPRDRHPLLRVPAGDRSRRLGPAVPLLSVVRPVDGLPGVPDEPHQGTLRPHRLHPRGRRHRSRLHREDHHRRRPHHHRRLHRLRPRPTRHVPADGLRRRDCSPPRRHPHPHRHPPQRPQPPRPPLLVPPPLAGLAAPPRDRSTRRPPRRRPHRRRDPQPRPLRRPDDVTDFRALFNPATGERTLQISSATTEEPAFLAEGTAPGDVSTEIPTRKMASMDNTARTRQRILAIFLPVTAALYIGAAGVNPKGTDQVINTTAVALKVLPIAAKHPTQLYLSGSLTILALGALAVSYMAMASLVRTRSSTVATVAAVIGGLAAFSGAITNVLVGINLATAATAPMTRGAAAQFLVASFVLVMLPFAVAMTLLAARIWKAAALTASDIREPDYVIPAIADPTPNAA